MLFVVVQDNEIVHVSAVPLFPQSTLDVLVERVEIDVGHQLAGEVANRYADTWSARLAVAVDDVVQQL